MNADNVLPFLSPGDAGFSPGTRFRSLDLTAPFGPRRPFSGASGRFGAVVTIDACGDVEPPPAEAAPSRRARIVRRPAPVLAQAMPDPTEAPPMPERHFLPPQAAVMTYEGMSVRPGSQKNGFWFAVFLMIFAWAGVVAAGAMFFNTPRSGFKVEWR